ncbi:MAG: transposase, partial [Treponema sp.]|nr:transposase [Treponema sp.]
MSGVRFERRLGFEPPNKARAGGAIIMDRASFHKKRPLEEICGKAKVNLELPPAYSPDFNPMEKGWANMKRVLRGAAPLCDSLQTAIYDCWRQVFLPRTTI